MDTAHWPHQDIGLVKHMEVLMPSSSAAIGGNNVMARPPQQLMGGGGVGGDRRVRPQKEQALNCPRCNSTNTKFCYYNNYSLTQPRYFCKTCRRYWTEGGSLRNVPVGGGSRKNKRSSSTSTSSAANASSSASANTSSLTTSLPTLSSSSSSKNPKFLEGQDLNLAFPAMPEFGSCTKAATTAATNLSAMELLRSTGMQQGLRGPLNPFMPMHPMTIPEYPSGFGVQDFRANSPGFPLDGGASGGYGAGLQEGSAGRLLFPFEESRGPVSSNAGGSGAEQFDQNNKGGPPGFWNGMMGGGGGAGGGGGGGSW